MLNRHVCPTRPSALLKHVALLALVAIAGANRGGAQTIPPRVSLVEELRLDATKEDFSVVGPIAVGPRGRIAIAFVQDRQVRIYEADGRLVAKVGRRGRGPGEFELLNFLGWMADTLWVNDISQQRTTLFTPAGALIRTVPIPASVTPTYDRSSGQPRPTGRFASSFAIHGMLPDGSMLGNAALTPSEATGRRSRAYLLVPPSGEPRVLTTFPELEGFNPLVFRPQVLFAPDGSRFVRVTVDSMAVTGGTFTIAAFTLNGQPAFTRTMPYAGERLSQGAIDSAMARMMPARGSEGDEPAIRRQMEAEQAEARKNVPPVHIPIGRVLLGADGTTWVGLRAAGDRQTIVMLNARGVPTSSISLPRTTTIAAGNGTHVWLRESDADGLVSVVRYRLGGVCAPPGCR